MSVPVVVAAIVAYGVNRARDLRGASDIHNGGAVFCLNNRGSFHVSVRFDRASYASARVYSAIQVPTHCGPMYVSTNCAKCEPI